MDKSIVQLDNSSFTWASGLVNKSHAYLLII